MPDYLNPHGITHRTFCALRRSDDFASTFVRDAAKSALQCREFLVRSPTHILDIMRTDGSMTVAKFKCRWKPSVHRFSLQQGEYSETLHPMTGCQSRAVVGGGLNTNLRSAIEVTESRSGSLTTSLPPGGYRGLWRGPYRSSVGTRPISISNFLVFQVNNGSSGAISPNFILNGG